MPTYADTDLQGQIDSIITTPREYILEAVTKAHNVVLDPTVWIIVYMMARGCFGPQYQVSPCGHVFLHYGLLNHVHLSDIGRLGEQ